LLTRRAPRLARYDPFLRGVERRLNLLLLRDWRILHPS
jgi:hypothetical protein